MSEETAKLKSEIVRLIDESRDVEVKMAFYSDERVQSIMDRLNKEWESNGYKGIPLDYATVDELKTLHDLARFYSTHPTGAYREFMRAAYGIPTAKPEKKSWWRRLLGL
ncbi:hypothetical protein TCELL_1142 [Thermogladius calderae 1633]|uniref:Uncharacterized protein n=1 Tax=Thermogladius calderae (strain DSM 22663 / VKM B-2946 / 1633) TaxID=1184251 RepID=I3TFM7_THEC1|nr:hypothetical protein [Thermogladius calderae]AFK51565.1 hypothetical protein TCELL_1142 [Thermogladius calderae 1633]